VGGRWSVALRTSKGDETAGAAVAHTLVCSIETHLDARGYRVAPRVAMSRDTARRSACATEARLRPCPRKSPHPELFQEVLGNREIALAAGAEVDSGFDRPVEIGTARHQQTVLAGEVQI